MTSPPLNVVAGERSETAPEDIVLAAPYTEQQKRAVYLELEKIAGSEVFVSSPASQRLLRFLVTQELAGESASLKESYIGHMHYGRKPDYDTKRDALVRVNMKRLRGLLELYDSRAEGRGELRIELAKGSYVPRYFVSQGNETQPAANTAEPVADNNADAPREALQSVSNSSGNVLRPTTHGQTTLLHGSTPTYVFLIAICILVVGAAAFFTLRQGSIPVASDDVWMAHPFLHVNGLAVFPSWSPRGDAIAFALATDTSPSDHSRIMIENVHTGALTELDTGQAPSTRPAWSPSGLQLAYIATVSGVRQIRVFSFRDHTQRTVATLSGSFPWLCQVPHLAWSRDETHMFTTDQPNPGEACSIFSVDLTTGSRQRLTQPTPGVIADVEPMLSRDGRQIAFLRNTGTLVGDIYTMNLDGTNLHRVTWENRDIMGFCWDADDRNFILASRRDDGVLRLWQTVQKGGLVRLTDGLTSVGFPALSPDGNTILFSAYHHSSSIWRAWVKGGEPEPLVVNDSVNADAVFSPDGRQIAFRSDASGSNEIWLADADGKHSRRITFLGGPFVDHLAWSPDGRQLAFDCRDSGHTSICLMPAEGGPVRHPVPWSSDEEMPSFSSDGKSLLFTSDRSGSPEIYAFGLESAAATVVPVGPGLRGAQVPGESILVSARTQPQSGLYSQPFVSQANRPDPTQARFVLPVRQDQLREIWSTAPGGVWFVGTKSADGPSEIFALSLPTGVVSPVLKAGHSLVRGEQSFSVSSDGKSALLVEDGIETAGLDMLKRSHGR